MTHIKNFSELGIEPEKSKHIVGDKISYKKILGQQITVHFYKIVPSNYKDKGNGLRLDMQIEFNKELRLFRTGATELQAIIKKIPETSFPFNTIIQEENEVFKFT